jgi:hypothetical protein
MIQRRAALNVSFLSLLDLDFDNQVTSGPQPAVGRRV